MNVCFAQLFWYLAVFYAFVFVQAICHGALRLDMSSLFTSVYFEHLFNLY